MNNSVAVLIVNWKSTALLARCLDCIIRQESIVPEIFVLDNGNEDPIPEDYFSKFPAVQFHKSEKNIGFSAGNNLLFQKTKEFEWVALVNPDAFLEKAWLSKMLSAAIAHPDYSFFASRLVREIDHEILDGDGDIMHISGLAWRRDHDLSITKVAIKPREVFSPCAAAALYRRYVLEAVDGFDEDFFCYFEDVDLGFRLRLSSQRCLLVPDAVAYHVGSATTGGQHSDFAVYYGHRNLVWAYVKNMPGALFWLLLPAHVALNLVSIVLFSIYGKGTIILKAKWDALCGMPRIWRKRRDIQKNRKVSIGEIWQVLDKKILTHLTQLWQRCS